MNTLKSVTDSETKQTEHLFSKLGNLLKLNRNLQYRSIAEFIEKCSISISPNHIYRIENCYNLPKIETALEIARALKIPDQETVYAWTQDSMPTSKEKSYFKNSSQLLNKPTSKSDIFEEKNCFPISRLASKLIEADPFLWELATYISVNHGEKQITTNLLVNEFNLDEETIIDKLKTLHDIELLDLQMTKTNSFKINSTRSSYIPEKKEFDILKRILFDYQYDKFNGSKVNNPLNTSYFKNLNILVEPEDIETIKSIIYKTLYSFSSFTKEKMSSKAIPFSINLFTYQNDFKQRISTEKSISNKRTKLNPPTSH